MTCHSFFEICYAGDSGTLAIIMQQYEWDFQQNVRDNIFGMIKTIQFLLKSASLKKMDEQVKLFYTYNYTFDQIFEFQLIHYEKKFTKLMSFGIN